MITKKLFNVYVGTADERIVVQLMAENHDTALESVQKIILNDKCTYEVKLK
tara:strand:+ start:415 stop:567 length:153 start_codon:yes stop_codon:yes gene_type:complete